MGDGFEHEVQALARQIAAAGASERAHLFHLGRWSERVLDWAMSHPGFKTELFRFVDVFPACRDDADVLRHLSEYFTGVDVPRALGLGLEVAERVPFGARLSTAAARRNIMRMARQLIAGATPEDALPRLAALWRAGEACTVDLLGEKTVTEREAARYAARVRAMLDALVAGTREWPAAPHLERDPWGAVPRVNLSVKPTALSALFAPASARDGLAEARERLLPILRRAREAGATVHLDMEHDDVKDLTLELLRGLGAEFPDGPQLGCVIQAYRKDAFADLRAVVAWSERALRLPLAVRLVKGAYWDFETVVAAAEGWPVPVFQTKAETAASYERCARYLVDHAGEVRPAFGSHNVRSLAYAVAYTRARDLPETAVELQLLYGMAEPIHVAVRRLGFRVRAYAPVGDLIAGMAYLVRRLLENTSNESFIRHRFAEGQALETLIAPPAVRTLPEPESEAAPRAPTDAAAPHRARSARGLRGGEAPRRGRRRRLRGDRLLRVLRAAGAAAQRGRPRPPAGGRDEPLPLPSARRGRRHRALELPARHPGGDGHRVLRHRQLRRLQARRADARDRLPARRGAARGGRPARRARLPARDGRRGRAPGPPSRRRLRRVHGLEGGRAVDHRRGRRAPPGTAAREARRRRDGRQERDRGRQRLRPRPGRPGDRGQRLRLRRTEVLGGLARDRRRAGLRRARRTARRRGGGRARRAPAGAAHRRRSTDRRGCVPSGARLPRAGTHGGRGRAPARRRPCGRLVRRPDRRGDRPAAVPDRHRGDLRAVPHGHACGRLRRRARARQRHRVRAHGRALLALPGAHSPRRRGAASRECLRQPGHHGRARRLPAVRRLRPLGRGVEGRRAGLPAPARRAACR